MFLSKLKIPDELEKAFFAFDKDGIVFFISGFEQFFANSAKDLMHKNYLNIFATEYTKRIKEEKKKLTNKNKTTHLTIQLNNDTKTKRILTLSILLDKTGKQIGYIGELELDKEEQKKQLQLIKKQQAKELDEIGTLLFSRK